MISRKRLNVVLVSILAVVLMGAHGDDAWAKKKKKNKTPKATTKPIVLPPKLTLNLIEKQRSESLSKTLKDGTTSHWLTSEGDNTFLILHRTSIAARNKGTILLLPENEHHPDWPGIIHYLRTELPNDGWATVSLALPDYLVETKIPPRSKPTAAAKESSSKKKKGKKSKKKKKQESEQGESTISDATKPNTEKTTPEKPKKPIQERTNHRIGEALNFIKGLGGGGKLVIVAEGLSALWITNYLTTNKARLHGIIFIGGRDAPELDQLNLTNSAIPLKRPLLDITSRQDASYQGVIQRSKLAKQAGHKQYQRVELSASASSNSQTIPIYRRIKGWLKRNFGD